MSSDATHAKYSDLASLRTKLKPFRYLGYAFEVLTGKHPSKDDVGEVQNGNECGMGIKNYKDIKPGDKICIIEAMKLFNDIESEVSGKIVKILVDDSSPVEFDQPLFLVDPS